MRKGFFKRMVAVAAIGAMVFSVVPGAAAATTETVCAATTNGVCKASDGNWYYYKNGVVQTSYTGFQENANGKWYIENGKVTFKKNSVIKDKEGTIGTKGTWYYVVGSKVQTSFTGLANYKNENGWWYIKNGEVDFTFTGIAENKNGWWYLKNGKVDFTYNKTMSGYKIKNGKVTDSHKTVTMKNGYETSDDNSYSGRLIVGDSRTVQLYAYNNYQYYNQASFVSVWGYRYGGTTKTIDSSARVSTMKTYVQNSIKNTGSCDVYIFATVNAYNGSGDYKSPVSKVISLAKTAKTWSAKFNGKTVYPTVYVVNLNGGKGKDVSSYNTYLSSQAKANSINVLSITGCLSGSNGGFLSDNLHYNDATLKKIWAKIL